MPAPEVARYERKYVVTEAKAQALRKYVGAFLVPDQHMPADEVSGYRVFTLYLDSPRLELYRQTVEGIKNRFKLRIRFYELSEEAPAFLEIKSRNSETIRKERAAVSRSAAESFLNGADLSPTDLLSPGENTFRVLAEFCQRCGRLAARPTAFVSYWREAYVARVSERVRVTFDRHVVGHQHCAGHGLNMPAPHAPVAPEQVVLELKYNGAMPGWMQGLVRSFHLERISFPKYVKAARALKLDRNATERATGRVRC